MVAMKTPDFMKYKHLQTNITITQYGQALHWKDKHKAPNNHNRHNIQIILKRGKWSYEQRNTGG